MGERQSSISKHQNALSELSHLISDAGMPPCLGSIIGKKIISPSQLLF